MTDAPLVLSLFPGIDLLGRAFGEQGFCVVRGGDPIFGGDVRTEHYPPGRFDGVIGGPPCQAFSRLANIVKANGHRPRFGNLIPEFERCVTEAEPQWFLMEEVPDAPIPRVDGYGLHVFLLDNRQLGEIPRRLRRWSFGWRGGRRVLEIETVALFPREFEYAATGGASSNLANHDKRRIRKTSCLRNVSRSQKGFDGLKRKQGLPADFDLPGWTVTGKCQAVGNAVPMAMGRALAKAVSRALASDLTSDQTPR